MADSNGQHGTARIAMMRSPLGRARGFGSAKSGVGHWWMQRLTAIALVPLGLWFVASMLAMLWVPRATVVHWVANPINTVLLLCLIAAVFYHMQLGLRVVIEDYTHAEARKIAALLVMNAVTLLLALGAFVSVLKMAFGAG